MYSQIALPAFTHARRYASTGSTMDLARDLVHQHPPRSPAWCAVVMADEQTAGRGRQGRTWTTSAGALMATYVFASDAPVSALAGYSLAVGVALAQALEVYGVRVQLKWPNDIVVVDDRRTLKKLGGVLVEVQELAPYRCILIGVGINTRKVPEELRATAVSMEQMGATSVAAVDLVSPLGSALQAMHQRFIAEGGFAAVRGEWIERSCFVAGQSELVVDLGDGEKVSGRFATVDPTGALVLDITGSFHTLLSGHITSYTL